MDDSFFRSHWNTPFYPVHMRPIARGFPAHDIRMPSSPRVVAIHPNQRSRPEESSNVVTIPVQCVDMERRRSESAVRIQKVFRGFMSRKSVKKIAAVKKEADEIEKGISAKGMVDSIRRNSREHLEMNEMLMSLLLRLDAVRGLDPGVRSCRKTVIRKVVALQGVLDAIVDMDGASVAKTTDGVARTTVEEALDITDAGKHNREKFSDSCSVIQMNSPSPDHVGNEPEPAELAADTDEIPQIQIDNLLQLPEQFAEITQENGINEAEGERIKTNERRESQTDSSANPESPAQVNGEKEEEKKQRAVEATEEETSNDRKQKNTEMLERMMEDNERMMDMMAELFERNEMQTRLLRSLSQRVEQLEKAFVCDRIRRKKKMKAAPKAEAPAKSRDVDKMRRG